MKAKAKETSARIGLAALAGAGMTFAFPALAFAAEGESSGGLSAILPDMAEFIPMLVIFILLWIVLAKFGWPKFEAMLEKREMTIKDSLEKSEQARVESERVLEEYDCSIFAAFHIRSYMGYVPVVLSIRLSTNHESLSQPIMMDVNMRTSIPSGSCVDCLRS